MCDNDDDETWEGKERENVEKAAGNEGEKGRTLRLKPERRKMRETPMVLTVHSGFKGPPMRPN